MLFILYILSMIKKCSLELRKEGYLKVNLNDKLLKRVK